MNGFAQLTGNKTAFLIKDETGKLEVRMVFRGAWYVFNCKMQFFLQSANSNLWKNQPVKAQYFEPFVTVSVIPLEITK